MTGSYHEAPAFDRASFDRGTAQLGEGPIGSKAQGLVFFAQMLEAEYEPSRFPGVVVSVPGFAVLAADVFDDFLDHGGLRDTDWAALSDAEIGERFQAAALPPALDAFLSGLIAEVTGPLAIRSASLMEDSIFCPLAGVYETKMIPNDQADDATRRRKIEEAVKLVYASTFFREARDYVEAMGRSHADEKMTVVIQSVVGSARGGRFYPHLSGVARSHNFYPTGSMKSEEGVVSLALGLGKTIVEGGVCWTYSPARPSAPPPFGSMGELMDNTQLDFWAIDLTPPAHEDPNAETEHLVRARLEDAKADGTLRLVASTVVPGSDRLAPGVRPGGPQVVDFGPLLKMEQFPLNAVIRELLDICERAAGTDVEIEFAMAHEEGSDTVALGFLQVRPMFVSHETVEIDEAAFARPDCIVVSRQVMGNGSIAGVRDIVFVDPDGFDVARSRQVGEEVARLNESLRARGRPYVLIGFGRWGTSDPWLGIPVTWPQIAGAKVIVECSRPDLPVDPSQGSHFFHNVMSTGVAYFAISHHHVGAVDWEWLKAQDAVATTTFLRHVELDRPLEIRVDGRGGRAGIWTG